MDPAVSLSFCPQKKPGIPLTMTTCASWSPLWAVVISILVGHRDIRCIPQRKFLCALTFSETRSHSVALTDP